ncbi:folate-binding protein YgfZ [[Leptolyngbya] sp. PCC 7376]|uniref:CAF17-like 4Fe-4S cluster assembly/insertion protein YgfZ n=1 Tax=[Leptolyngbya] sp. PCC 7376 TaxID=111781 RepID=UPI00029F2417|nr:folate-binding protein YgfZ [[Leptolyngbya] sp. PCC 7376]AFY40410.1 folate-binding protein YgfZ [[Leptolyngbya] sp. PCC 7376]
MTPLLTYHQQQGATLNDAGNAVLSFGADDQITAALKTGCVVGDRSHWGLIKFTGADRQRYLHNQSTNQIQQLQPGQSCDTVLVNSTARTIDLATVHIFKDELWVSVSPSKTEFLMEWFDRFLFPMDKVEISDITGQFSILTLYGSESRKTLEQLTETPLQIFPDKGHQAIAIGEAEIICATGTDLGFEGFTLFVPIENAVELWQKIIDLGAVPMGETAWEKQRIHQGRPAPDTELADDYNPLEAGLWHCISFDKGCYIGQETIARLNTYKGVKQRLFGLKLAEAVEPGTKLTVDGERAGIVTSVDAENKFAIGYVRTKSGDVGDVVTAGDVMAEVVALPYVSHEYPEL